jgi:phospholipid/cholesterol/gamma-HCH transport system permease protein
MPASEKPPEFAVVVHGEGDKLSLDGILDIHSLDQAKAALGQWLKPRKSRALDLGKLSGLDTSGALFLCELRDRKVELTGVSAEHEQLLALICGLERKPLPTPKTIPRWREIIIEIGKGADAFGRDAYDVLVFVARALNAVIHALLHPSTLRPASISRQISETGIKALPIVGVMAIMISVVIGYQGLVQLRPYGGDEFMINLVGVSMLREMGVLITAIMVAGRSGSAFAAEIGVMKSREEIDALEVMGLGPMELLVVPRLLAIMITLPLLTFFADIMGLIGGAIISLAQLDIAPMPYLERLRLAVDTRDLLVGLVKAPIFAFFIGAIGCMHGLRVAGSAESVGRETTRAVVKAIFLVIIFDALFSVFFERVGW